MKELDQLVENFLQPKPKAFGLDQLVEMVEQMMTEAVDEDAVKAVEAFAQGKGYEVERKTEQILIIRSDDRAVTRDDFKTATQPGGELEQFEYDRKGSTMGRIFLRGVRGKTRQLSVYFKSTIDTSSGGASGARVGREYEEKIEQMIKDIGDPDISTDTAGSGHGSDLVIAIEGKEPLTIEAKTSLAADFGQFRVRYNTIKNEWEPTPSKIYLKHELTYGRIFKELKPRLAQISYPNENHDNLRKGSGRDAEGNLVVDDEGKPVEYILGLADKEKTGVLKRELQSLWFNGKESEYLPFDFAAIAKKYANKGDKLIQIMGKGLYALDPASAKQYDVPLFEDAGLVGSTRVRLKPTHGEDSSHSLVLANKVSGKLKTSPVSLDNPDDLQKIISIYKNT